MPTAKNIYLIGGSDEFSVKEAASKLAGKLAPKNAGEFGVEIIDGTATNQDEALKVLGRLYEALQTVGFFGAEKLVWLKSTNLLADDRAVMAEAVKDGLAALSEALKRGLPDGVTLLISAVGLDKRRSLYLTLKKLAEIQEFDAPEAGKPAGEEDIREFVQTKMRAEGKGLNHAGYQAFRELVAPDLREIANELEKLFLYVGKRLDITDRDVRAICSATREAGDFELANIIGERNLPKAIRVLEMMLQEEEKPIGILVRLVSQFRLILLMRDLLERKLISVRPPRDADDWRSYSEFKQNFEHLPDFALDHFPKTKEKEETKEQGQKQRITRPSAYRAFRCAVAAQNFTTAELIRAMDLLLDANRQLVTTGLDECLILEETVAKIARKPAL